jgi:hypothetical protein
MARRIDAPPEVVAACDPSMPLNMTKRLTHLMKDDGTPCSAYKGAALTLRRTPAGWDFMCFRCDCFGRVPLDKSSPKETKKILETVKESRSMLSKPDELQLPMDSVPLQKADANSAKNWMAQYGLNELDWKSNYIKWSANFARIIFPIYEYEENAGHLYKSLIGWTGRDPYIRTKEERVMQCCPKYLTKKDPNAKRIYFQARFFPHNSWKEHDIGTKLHKNDILIVVEDIISAIKVNKATGIATVALLNTSVSHGMLNELGYKKILFWLDDDAFNVAVRTTARFNSLGYRCKVLRTIQDPKIYAEMRLRLYLEPVLEDFYNNETNNSTDS